MKFIKSSTRFAMRYALQVSKFPHGLHAKHERPVCDYIKQSIINCRLWWC